MTEPNERVDALRASRIEILYGLNASERHLARATRLKALEQGVRRACRVFFALALIYFAWRLGVFALGLADSGLGGWAALVIGLVIAVAPIPWRVFQASGQEPDARDAAERLDLASGTKNRIAAALDLSAGDVGPFEAAAIADGVRALERVREREPHLDAARIPSVLELSGAYLGLLLLLGAAFLPTGAVEADDENPAVGRTPVASRSPGRAAGETPTPAEERARSRRDASKPLKSTEREAKEGTGRGKAARNPTGDRQKASGRPGKGKSGEARQARQSSVSQGDPTEGQTPAGKPKERKPRKKKERKSPDTARMVKPKKMEGQQTGATVGQGGSGGGAMSPVKSPWLQKDRTDDEPLPENPAEEDIEDEIEEEEARGGTQPSLRDRKAATSRDLSISGPGEGGEGRGGPTPQKKARGTASLVLGVPVPDFVRGLLNPGTTKVTHERVEPVTSPGKTAPTSPATARKGLEPRVKPARVPAALRLTVRRFLKALHDSKVKPSSGS